MILGGFVFGVRTAGLATIERHTSHRYASNERLHQRAAHQNLGAGEDSMTLPIIIYPEFAGGVATIDSFREMQATGQSFILITGTGHIKGYWIVKEVEETQSYLIENGAPQKIEASLELWRTDKTLTPLGSIANAISSL